MQEINQQHISKENEQIGFLDLVHIVVKRWKICAKIIGIVSLISILFISSTKILPSDSPLNPLPDIYTPEVKVKIDEKSGGISQLLSASGLGSIASLLGASSGNSSTNAQFALEILKSKTLVDRIVKEFDFRGRYKIEHFQSTGMRRIFLAKLKSEQDSKSGIITIKYSDIDAEFATKVVNRAVDLLEQRFRELLIIKIGTKKEFLEETLGKARKELEVAKDNLIQFQKKNGIVSMTTEAEAMVGQLATINSRIIDKELELYNLKRYRSQNDPQVLAAQGDLEILKQLLNETKRGYTDFSSAFKPINSLPEIAATYASFTAEFEIQKTIYTTLRAQFETAKIEEMDNSRQFQIIERAEVPEMKSGPRRSLILVVATITAFFLCIFGIFVVEFFERMNHDPQQSEKIKEIMKFFDFKKPNVFSRLKRTKKLP